MDMTRAYSVIEIKEINEGDRTFSGIATTPATDLVDDIVEPKGAEFSLPIPLLWQHRHDQPIGHVTEARVTDKGIFVKGSIAKIDEPGSLKTRLDEAWQSMKLRLVAGLSIGFKGIETSRIEGTFGTRFTKWRWLELSAVTIAANSEAMLTAIKSIDNEIRAKASDAGADQSVEPNTEPAATGNTVRVVKFNDTARDRAKPFVIREIKRI